VQSHEAIVPEPKRDADLGGFTDDAGDVTIVSKDIDRHLRAAARRAALARGDGLFM
jgi:hypothetical protein